MTNRGAAHFRSIKTSCIRYFSVCNFLKDENSLNLPRGSTNSFQLAYFCLIFSRIAKNLFRAISRVLWLWSPVSHWCCKHSWAFKRFSLVLIKSLRIKSLPSSLTLTKASSSNCQLEIRKMVFCYKNCPDLLWEKNVLVIEKNFWNSRLKAKNLPNFWDH